MEAMAVLQGTTPTEVEEDILALEVLEEAVLVEVPKSRAEVNTFTHQSSLEKQPQLSKRTTLQNISLATLIY
jgi:hypothetical protein